LYKRLQQEGRLSGDAFTDEWQLESNVIPKRMTKDQLQRRHVRLFQSIYQRLLSADALQTAEARYVFSGELRDVPQAETVMSTCVFSKTDGHLIQGELYDLPKVSGRSYFC
jgi:hypothetical protein